jgi:hypothetical protein
VCIAITPARIISEQLVSVHTRRSPLGSSMENILNLGGLRDTGERMKFC